MTVKLDPELCARIDAHAERRGMTRTEFFERAARRELGDRPESTSVRRVARRRDVAPFQRDGKK